MERWWYKVVLRLRSIFQSTRVEAELDEELRIHWDQQVQVHLDQGLTLDEARRGATMAIGGLEQRKDLCRDTRGTLWIQHLARDVSYGARALRLNPGFAVVAILSLTLGIGANTAIFQLINAVRLRSLPVPHPEELVEVRIAGGNGGLGVTENEHSQVSLPLWEQIRGAQRAFAGAFAWGTSPFLVGTGADSRLVLGLLTSGEAFSVLGVIPAHGRLLGITDDRPGCAPAVVLNYAFWQAQFGSDPAAVGRTLPILDRPVPIIGVTSQDFAGLDVGTGRSTRLVLVERVRTSEPGVDCGTCRWSSKGSEPGPDGSDHAIRT
jgi:hypothetical protein